MDYKRKCEGETRKYLKKMQKNLLTAFDLGFNDGAAGRKQECAPTANPEEDGLNYAAQAFAHELYKLGLRCWEKVK